MRTRQLCAASPRRRRVASASLIAALVCACDVPELPSRRSSHVCPEPSCVDACDPGWADCDDDLAANGCETDLTSASSCGACGRVCASGAGCVDGACGPVMPAGGDPPSCRGLAQVCGVDASDDCCARARVPGGAFHRGAAAAAPATVSALQLDLYEVSVGRFRRFVDAVVGGWRPTPGAGLHAHLAGGRIAGEPGWEVAWSARLRATASAWSEALACSPSATWTASPDVREPFPVSCVTWIEAQAFCIWDGGFLPSQAEWAFAAAGGDEQRPYPWGASPPDPTRAVFACAGDGSAPGVCSLSDVLRVGSRGPAGAGRWGHADLAGGMREWVLDAAVEDLPVPCVDCAELGPGPARASEGGSWADPASSLASTARGSASPDARSDAQGLRCARVP